VTEGRNNMRPILDVSPEEIKAIYTYLQATNPYGGFGGGRRAGPSSTPLPPGPVVATGGVPRPPLPPRYAGPFYPGVGGTTGNMPWPEDVAAAKVLPTRYQSGYNVMATATKPPYTTITAYDLNTGDIKWQVGNGDDPATIDHFGKGDGPRDTGGVGTRNGMLITRTGLLFQNGKDGFARAYDVETGKVLWKGKTAGQSIGIPAMYESQGRQYIVFMSPPAGRGGGGERPSTTDGAGGGAGIGGSGAPQAPAAPAGPYGYIAFALPKK
jgi:quinoprotein glucose dehydrogenase